ncbi:possible N-acetylglucosamine kinase [Synechococcus sp. WH 8103]|nr:possible N-acetylglucosamine kinase [Synechococcus sp. WH 8103]
MLLAGFDAGQTSTRCRVCLWQEVGWQIIGESSGPGVSHLEASGGAERFRQAVLTSLTSAFEGEGERRLDAAVIGASGIEQGSALQPKATALLADALSLPEDRVLATGDERTALRGAFPDGDGIILISGTGMICLGRDHQGKEHRCGGWGWMLDGAGSAFDLGHQGLQLTLQMADGRRPDHPLRQRMWEQLGCRGHTDVKAWVVQPSRTAADLAALAPLLVAAADAGLPAAQDILQRSASALVSCAATVARELALPQPAVAGLGGVLKHQGSVQRAVEVGIIAEIPGARWAPAASDACWGALTMARELVLRPR